VSETHFFPIGHTTSKQPLDKCTHRSPRNLGTNVLNHTVLKTQLLMNTGCDLLEYSGLTRLNRLYRSLIGLILDYERFSRYSLAAGSYFSLCPPEHSVALISTVLRILFYRRWLCIYLFSIYLSQYQTIQSVVLILSKIINYEDREGRSQIHC
jgi:hypothetical protein